MEVSFELSLQASFVMCSSSHCTVHLAFITIYQSINVNFLSSFSVLLFGYFFDLILYYLCFVLYSHYGDSMSNIALLLLSVNCHSLILSQDTPIKDLMVPSGPGNIPANFFSFKVAGVDSPSTNRK